MAYVIVDANIVFSGLGGSEQSFPSKVMQNVFTSESEPLFSEDLLREYARLLARPKAQVRHGFTGTQLLEFVQQLRSIGTVIEPDAGPPCPDPNDQHLWDLLATEPAALLVTGDGPLLRSNHFPGRVLSPRQFVERYLDD